LNREHVLQIFLVEHWSLEPYVPLKERWFLEPCTLEEGENPPSSLWLPFEGQLPLGELFDEGDGLCFSSFGEELMYPLLEEHIHHQSG
jgi:hypothetical protein